MMQMKMGAWCNGSIGGSNPSGQGSSPYALAINFDFELFNRQICGDFNNKFYLLLEENSKGELL